MTITIQARQLIEAIASNSSYSRVELTTTARLRPGDNHKFEVVNMNLQTSYDGECRILSNGDIEVRVNYVRPEAEVGYRLTEAYSQEWRCTGLQTADLPRRGAAADWQHVAEYCGILDD